jgi:hypothetical protein
MAQVKATCTTEKNLEEENRIVESETVATCKNEKKYRASCRRLARIAPPFGWSELVFF